MKRIIGLAVVAAAIVGGGLYYQSTQQAPAPAPAPEPAVAEAPAPAPTPAEKLKACWIYVGPVGDHG